jgi:hypothetical protein
MTETIQFPYSKKTGLVTTVVMLVMGLLLLTTCIKNYLAHDIPGVVIFAVFALIIFAVMVLMIVVRFVPALKGEIAMELNEQGINDYLRNITLDWKDIEDIELKPGRSSAMLIFELKFDSDFGKRVAMSLRWVEGRDHEIYDTVLGYFDEVEGIVRGDDEEES